MTQVDTIGRIGTIGLCSEVETKSRSLGCKGGHSGGMGRFLAGPGRFEVLAYISEHGRVSPKYESAIDAYLLPA